MKANLSLILNVLLLIGVVIAIARIMKARRRSLVPANYPLSLGPVENKPFDDIIAVRKINHDLQIEEEAVNNTPPVKTAVRKTPLVDAALARKSSQESEKKKNRS